MQSFNRLINHLNIENARKLRKWESINMKIINATRANMFNQNCLREKLRPKGISRKSHLNEHVTQKLEGTSQNGLETGHYG